MRNKRGILCNTDPTVISFCSHCVFQFLGKGGRERELRKEVRTDDGRTSLITSLLHAAHPSVCSSFPMSIESSIKTSV